MEILSADYIGKAGEKNDLIIFALQPELEMGGELLVAGNEGYSEVRAHRPIAVPG